MQYYPGPLYGGGADAALICEQPVCIVMEDDREHYQNITRRGGAFGRGVWHVFELHGPSDDRSVRGRSLGHRAASAVAAIDVELRGSDELGERSTARAPDTGDASDRRAQSASDDPRRTAERDQFTNQPRIAGLADNITEHRE